MKIETRLKRLVGKIVEVLNSDTKNGVFICRGTLLLEPVNAFVIRNDQAYCAFYARNVSFITEENKIFLL